MKGKPARPSWLRRVQAATSVLDAETPHLVGVSGGLDSCVLLHLLSEFGFQRLVVCHFDHGLRGSESVADAAFVAVLADRLGLPFRSGSAEDRTARRGSVEAWARRVRYEFFARVARTEGVHSLVLGHQADDQVETALFRLLRGTASLGRAGMRARSEHAVAGVRLIVHRPLLSVWRQDLAAYARAGGIVWRDDPTNAQPVAARNRLRHELLPLASKIVGRDVKAPLLRALGLAEAEETFLQNATPELWQSETLPVAELRGQPVALQRRVVHLWLQARGLPDVGTAEVERVRGLADHPSPTKVNLPGDWHARRQAGRLFLEIGLGRHRRSAKPAETGQAPWA